jgi:GNAT acetyltransferase-like protein/SET domain-containing protein
MVGVANLDLLQTEMELLWGDRGGPALTIASTSDGLRVRFGQDLPEHLATAAQAWVERCEPTAQFETPPTWLEDIRVELQTHLRAGVMRAPGCGPTFLIEPDLTHTPTPAGLLIRSNAADTSIVQHANPGNWPADEWTDLVEGRLAPWAMAISEGRVVSICHTAVVNAHAADAGVWTHPRFRRLGYAAACTAAWAALMRPTGRRLFYSTAWTNRSSQHVAARLGLRHIGCLWQLQRVSSDAVWVDPRVAGGAATIERSGLYAGAPFTAGEVALAWGSGEIVSDAELHTIAASGRRYRSVSLDENQNIVWSAEEAGVLGPGGLNQSCNPNLWMCDARALCARRDIAAGEELTLDYALVTVSPDWRIACDCGEPTCRRLVTGNDWQLPEVQARYRGHFPPFINARIAGRHNAHAGADGVGMRESGNIAR